MLAILVGAGLILVGLAATFVLRVASEPDAERAGVLFLSLLGLVLSVVVSCLAVALATTPRPRHG